MTRGPGWVVCTLIAVALASGCIDSPQLDPQATTNEGQESIGPDDETVASPTTETAWKTETREGNLTQIHTIGTESRHSFRINESVITLYLNLTTEGKELEMGIVHPDCEEYAGIPSICEWHPTENGELVYRIDNPTPGDWSVIIQGNDLYYYEQHYVLEIATSFGVAV